MKDIIRSKQLQTILLIASLLAVLWFMFKNAEEVSTFSFSFSWKLLVLAAAFSITGHLTNFYIWYRLSSGFGIKTTILEGGHAWFLSRMGRYIPGKIPFILFRINAYKDYPMKTVTLATGVEYISSIAAAAFVVLIGIVSTPTLVPTAIKWAAAFCAVLIPVLLLPDILEPVYNYVLKFFKKSPFSGFPEYKTILLSVAGYIAAAFIHGLGFFLLLCSMDSIALHLYPAITAIYFAAGLVGLAAVFAPGGIGVLEGFMLLILPALIPEPVAIVGVIGIRIIVTVTELVLTGFFSGLHLLTR